MGNSAITKPRSGSHFSLGSSSWKILVTGTLSQNHEIYAKLKFPLQLSLEGSCLPLSLKESLDLLGSGVHKTRLGSNVEDDPYLVLSDSGNLCVLLGEA